jgi:hypothetical protein
MLKAVVYVFLLVACLLLLAIVLDSAGCNARWEDSGYKVSYSAMGGCKVNKDGKWLPETAIRSIEE